jgi:uncharacterized protein YbjQ (UPF0145 family)
MTLPAVAAAADLQGRPNALPIYTLEEVPGFNITEVKGLVRGNTIRARHVGKDLLAVFRVLVGGEITEYTKMMAEAREQALDRMRAEALARGANAIVCARITTSTVMQGAAEILAYGTAVTLESSSTEP